MEPGRERIGDRQRPAVEDLDRQIQELSWKMVRTQENSSHRLGMTHLQAFTLGAIREFGPEIDMASLVSITSLPPSSITSIVDRFVEQGYVTRQRDERDRRRVTATITGPGREQVALLEAERARVLEVLLDGVADEDIATVTRVVRHMTGQMEHIGQSPCP